MHKYGVPFRPFVTTIDRAQCKIAMWANLLRPLLVIDVMNSPRRLAMVMLSRNTVCIVLYEVEYSSTNIPLRETLDIVMATYEEYANKPIDLAPGDAA